MRPLRRLCPFSDNRDNRRQCRRLRNSFRNGHLDNPDNPTTYF